MTLRKILQFIYRAEIPNIILNSSVIAVCSTLFITGTTLSLDVVKFTTLPFIFFAFAGLYIANYLYIPKNSFELSTNQIITYNVIAILLATFNYFPKTSSLLTDPRWGEVIAASLSLISMWSIYALIQTLNDLNELHTADVKNPRRIISQIILLETLNKNTSLTEIALSGNRFSHSCL